MSKLSNTPFIIKGKSGNVYSFTLYSIEHDFHETKGGVYVFFKSPNTLGTKPQDVIYIGKANCFNQRFDTHEKWAAIKKHGANFLAILETTNETASLAIEKDIIQAHPSTLNVVHAA